MGLNDLRNEFKTEIAAIADDLANSLPLSKPQLRSAFTDNQIEEVHKLIKEINEAKDRNQKIFKLQENAKAAFGLLKKLGVGI